MKYVKAAWDDGSQGFFTDATAYLAALPELEGALPPGARAFACDPDHYRGNAARCVKDLELSDIRIATDKSGTLTPDATITVRARDLQALWAEVPAGRIPGE